MNHARADVRDPSSAGHMSSAKSMPICGCYSDERGECLRCSLFEFSDTTWLTRYSEILGETPGLRGTGMGGIGVFPNLQRFFEVVNRLLGLVLSTV